MRLILGLTVLVCLSGCSGYSQFIQGLNDRQLQSCIWYEGNGGPYMRITGVTATGDAKLDDCTTLVPLR